jgi:hypothetical protein
MTKERDMQEAANFILNGFLKRATLKEHDGSSTEVVQEKSTGTVYVRKIIPFTGLPYKELEELQHPGLPVIYYTAEDEGKTYVIEEFISGKTLEELQQQNFYFSGQHVWGLAHQICETLQVLHDHQILHRDIKPSNIIVKDDGGIKLIDFGAARLTKDKEQGHDTLILGTPGFAPPEQYGFAPTDVRSDIYALGMTMKSLLGPAYHGPLLKIIDRCTKFDPEQRVNSAREVQELLEDVVKKRLYRQATLILIGVVVVLAALGVLLWHLFRGPVSSVLPGAPPAAQTETVQTPAPDTAAKKTGATAQKEQKAPATTASDSEKTAAATATPAATPDTAAAATAPDSTANTEGTTSISLSSKGWNFSADGATETKSPVRLVNNMSPAIIITNRGSAPLKNPTLDLYFSDFGLVGSNTDQNVDAGYPLRTQVQFLNNGGATTNHVRIRVLGSIPVGKYAYLSPALAYPSYYRQGTAPAVRAVFKADNADSAESSYSINVR